MKKKSFCLSLLFFFLIFIAGFVFSQEEERSEIESPMPLSISAHPYGAKVYGRGMVPTGEHTPAEFSEKWDIGGFFNPKVPDVIQIPKSIFVSGRYVIHAAVRWYNPEGPIRRSYFNTYLKVNDSNIGNDARATANMVGGGATGTTQYFSIEVNLNAGDQVQLFLWHGFGVDINAEAYLTVTHRPR